ncbi:putative adenylate kinase 6 [Cucumis melo var. makuwa]|uniref:adenylate kinase n=1 Tax=Cucumis melo var. makuwa TaxID=1194695 RepID=A0A5A7SSB6_CUCMM|nr:putative adenylate kinase 6 [Cucumis melo var. makuwa]
MAVLNRFAGARAPATFYSSMFNYYALWKAFSSSSLSSEVDLKSTLLSRSSSSRPDRPMDRNVQWLAEIVSQGKLVSDEIIFDLLSKRLRASEAKGESGFILDGFPRTIRQAEILEGVTDIDLVVNLKLREEALLAKCLGRRICSECGGNYNITCIEIKDKEGRPELYMAPLLPPPNCASKLITRSDDTEAVVKERLRIYKETSQPVEDFYRRRGKLLEFDLPGGIPESWPKLLQALNLEDLNHKQSAAA